ncbi:MAG: mechanosensitive ion channel family protein [Epsilonproteobacteria bacterium]|nr:MAG: mechanosensitive ion channel family protein [Campylobacterota bacterium]
MILRLHKKETVLDELARLDQSNEYKNEKSNVTEQLEKFEAVQKTIVSLQKKRRTLLSELLKSLDKINHELDKDSIWEKSYNAYLTYLQLKHDLSDLHKRIEKLAEVGDTLTEKDELEQLIEKEKILNDQLFLLKGHGTSPFANLLQPEDIDEKPEIKNPIDIFTGISYNKRMAEQLKVYIKRGAELRQLMIVIRKKINVLGDIATIDLKNNYVFMLSEATQRLEKFEVALSTLVSTEDVYAKRVEEVELQVNKQIGKQLYKLVNIGIIIIVLFVFFFLTKMMAKKYITDNERFYMANKVITFVNVTLIILILLFNYIENVSYLVTVLGFASAGIAIAMKDWFMSMLGWLVIVIGGSIHVGDRVRVDKDGMLYVGDVLDISLLRITILEDITLTTYKHNRRAGRIIFIPNNYVFTTMIANYTHVSLKTVWDGIDIMITFDSNHKKAMHIAKEIARKYAKGYTDITRKQLNKLRNRYSLKNTNVEPRVFSFIEPYGVQISTWYLTNAYATLTLRSSISMEIMDAYKLEDDITIAYPTQHLNLSNAERKMPSQDEGTEII